MKLKNKRTGEIVEPYLEWCSNSDKPHSLAELNEEWEDYKEPKMYWAISMYSENGVDDFKWSNGLFGDDVDKFNKEIGNYFDTREEAEKAVEKLKAWKRLKDKGFRFNNFVRDAIYYEISDEEIEKDAVRKDLELLFGGKE